MINPIASSEVQALYSGQRNNLSRNGEEAVRVDRNNLFSSNELKTFENMKHFAKSQGMSEREIAIIDAQIITGKLAAQTASENASIKDILQNQIQGLQDGFGNEKDLSLQSLQNLYNNFHLFQGVNEFV
jgi:hypothetical protein